MPDETSGQLPLKRPAGEDRDGRDGRDAHVSDMDHDGILEAMAAPVSPPPKRRRTKPAESSPASFRSPFQLTAIRDLPAAANVDTVTIEDLVGHPLVSECWEFNYLHDVDFLMGALDADVRDHVQVHVVHGFWRRNEDGQRRQRLEADAARYANVHLHTAFMPEPFGTHHAKMAVLFRHDDLAQVAIYTANMIPHDWTNMTQGVWRSPLLPKSSGCDASLGRGGLGSGSRFKADLLSYLRAYNVRRPVCQPLVDRLAQYDFSAVQAALIASVPGRHTVYEPYSQQPGAPATAAMPTQWGWLGLQNTLRSVPVQAPAASAEIVAQVSSIATLGPTDAWIQRTLFRALASGSAVPEEDGGEAALQPQALQKQKQPAFRVVFPTADEIRRSLDGYVSGTSIHTKIQSPQQQKQLQYLRPMLCHWANDAPRGANSAAPREAGRKRAAPHIKTYVRYGQDGSIDWALLTSANLSKQAWGEAVTPAGEMRIASWEIGVLVWPGLFAETATMQVACGSDHVHPVNQTDNDRPVVALRVPYNLPLQRYGPNETPWVGSLPHSEPDWMGRSWDM